MENNTRGYDFLLKVILVGESESGKSSVLLKFTDDTFSSSHIPTIGVEFRVKTINIDESTVKLQIWDTAGAERFRAITRAYYRGSHGILLVLDRTNRQSFYTLDQKLEQIRNQIRQNVPIMLLGNKSDQIQNINVSNQQINVYIRQNNLYYIEVSAKTNMNITHAFEQLSRKIIANTTLQQNLLPRQDIGRRIHIDHFNQNLIQEQVKYNWWQIGAPAALLTLFVIVSLVSHI